MSVPISGVSCFDECFGLSGSNDLVFVEKRIVASLFHAPDGALPRHALGYVYLPAAIGVAAASVLAAPWGTRLAHRLSGTALRRVFALFLLAVALSVPASG